MESNDPNLCFSIQILMRTTRYFAALVALSSRLAGQQVHASCSTVPTRAEARCLLLGGHKAAANARGTCYMMNMSGMAENALTAAHGFAHCAGSVFFLDCTRPQQTKQ